MNQPHSPSENVVDEKASSEVRTLLTVGSQHRFISEDDLRQAINLITTNGRSIRNVESWANKILQELIEGKKYDTLAYSYAISFLRDNHGIMSPGAAKKWAEKIVANEADLLTSGVNKQHLKILAPILELPADYEQILANRTRNLGAKPQINIEGVSQNVLDDLKRLGVL